MDELKVGWVVAMDVCLITVLLLFISFKLPSIYACSFHPVLEQLILLTETKNIHYMKTQTHAHMYIINYLWHTFRRINFDNWNKTFGK